MTLQKNEVGNDRKSNKIHAGLGKDFRKSIIYENRIGFNTKMQLSEDSDFTLHYLMHCSRISISDTIFYHYSIDNESTMRSNADKKYFNILKL